ncbi:hypothetical protein ONE63_011548 [Megalurothrips usitatus]|uniref:Endonuclease/exonuclease/phosphatase domain-containing protein n=1 Tax=Megalurothrips usitatus TaxID=439358 RepID=A0AAV7WZ17_9NEOP|nr:hypothetical protein ONE63_011548 [Megalurothrips usitatus]
MNVLTVNLCAATSSKFEALRALLVSKKIDVALLQEVAAPRLCVPGYKEFTNIGEARRGTVILAREDLELTPLLALPSGRGSAAKVGNHMFICVYAPAGSKRRQERAAFFAEDVAQLLAVAGPHAILGGDFNCVVRDGDTTGATMKCPELQKLVCEIRLEDVWPRDPARPGHTFATATMSARLDRVYAPRQLAVQAAEVVPVAFSDHHGLAVAFDGEVPPRPPRPPAASWRFDARILKDPSYLASFKEEWARCVARRPVDGDVVQWWLREAKPAIRRHAAKFTRDFRREYRRRRAQAARMCSVNRLQRRFRQCDSRAFVRSAATARSLREHCGAPQVGVRGGHVAAPRQRRAHGGLQGGQVGAAGLPGQHVALRRRHGPPAVRPGRPSAGPHAGEMHAARVGIRGRRIRRAPRARRGRRRRGGTPGLRGQGGAPRQPRQVRRPGRGRLAQGHRHPVPLRGQA